MLSDRGKYTEELLTAIRVKDTRKTKKLLKKLLRDAQKNGTPVFDGEGSIGEKALLAAVECWNTRAVWKILAASGGVSGSFAWSDAALFRAVEKGYGDIVGSLLSAGANKYAEKDGDTPMELAAGLGNLGILKRFVAAGADVAYRTKDGGFALSNAVFHGQTECVAYLISAGADVNDSNNFGVTSLHWAATKGYDQIADLLINAGSDADATQNDGETPLLLSAAYGHTEVAEILIKAGADVNAVNAEGKTPLICAAQMGAVDLVQLLLESGADIDQTSDTGHTALTIAADNGREDVAKYLIQRGADINKVTSAGNTALMLAIEQKLGDTAELLINRGADIHISNQFGETALMYALAEQQKNTAEMLIEKGADVHAVSNSGYTPLMFAAMNGYFNIVDMLLQFGADPGLTTEKGITALDFAIKNRHDDVEMLLKEAISFKGALFDKESVDLLLAALQEKHYETYYEPNMDPRLSVIRTLGLAYVSIGTDSERERIFDAIWGCLVFENCDVFYHDVLEAAISFLCRYAPEKSLDKLFPYLLQSNSCQSSIIKEFGKSQDIKAFDMLTEALDQVEPFPASLISCALAKSGNPRAYQPVLNFLLHKRPRVGLYDPDINEHVKEYTVLFSDYTHVIFDLLNGITQHDSSYSGASGNEDPTYHYSYDTQKAREAVMRLCALKTPVSSNLLHFASMMRDLEVVTAEGYYYSSPEITVLSLSGIRTLAQEELKIRGNPPYDEAHYRVKGAWKL